MSDDDAELIEGMRRAQEAMKPKPHPDTARADAAERMLAGVIRSLECHDLNLLGSVVAVENTGLASWWADWRANHDREKLVADLTARLDRERAALEATKRELERLTR